MKERRASVVGASALSSQKACSAAPNKSSNSCSATGSPSKVRQWSFSSEEGSTPCAGLGAGGMCDDACWTAGRSRARRSGGAMFVRRPRSARWRRAIS